MDLWDLQITAIIFLIDILFYILSPFVWIEVVVLNMNPGRELSGIITR